MTVQYGCCYSYAQPASITDDVVQEMPPRLECALGSMSLLCACCSLALTVSDEKEGINRTTEAVCAVILSECAHLLTAPFTHPQGSSTE